MTLSYPTAWASLRYPWVRAELLDYLDELIDPAETAKWLSPDPQGPIIGIEQTFHFLFDDHDFDAGGIGYSLLDQDEVAATARVKEMLEAIHVENTAGDSRYFLEHPQWPAVVNAAAAARALIGKSGLMVE